MDQTPDPNPPGDPAPRPSPSPSPSANERAAGWFVGGLDLFQLMEATDQALKASLASYTSVFPPVLTKMGKFALRAPAKVMAFDLEAARSAREQVSLPRWPLQVLLSCQAAAGTHDLEAWKQALPAAVAVEIAMAAADLLDELADDDPSPFIRQYGPGQALNTGNLMLVMAQQVLANDARQAGGDRALAALAALQEMLVQAATGQHLDMLYERPGPGEVTLEMSQQMTGLKAGALMAGACRMGAIMAGAEERVVDLLARFGRELGGIAQLRNDIQDVLPQPQGESMGGPKTDLRLRKRTIPIVFALRDDSPEPNAVQRAFSQEGEPIDEEELRQAIVDAGGVRFALLVSEVHRQNAVQALAELEELRPGATEVLSFLLVEEK